MFGAILTGPRTIEFRDDIPVPEIKDKQILVRPKIMTVCGSDHPFYLGRCEYPLPPGFPWHETIGVVTQSRSEHFAEGDEVLAIPVQQHGYLDQFVANEDRAAVLPEWDEQLVLAQPLGTVLNGEMKLSSVEGKTVVIIGQGNIGLLWTQLMRVRGAARIIVVDLLANRLEAATQGGATDTINASETDPITKVTDLTDGSLGDVVVEAVGLPETQINSIHMAGHDAEVLFFGVPREREFPFPFTDFYRKHLRLTSTSSTNAWRDFPMAFDLIGSGQIDTKPIITHRLPHTELVEAMELAVDGRRGNAIKVLLAWD